jgi:predicted nucleotidyltransferase
MLLSNVQHELKFESIFHLLFQWDNDTLTKIFNKLNVPNMKDKLINQLEAYFEDKSEVIAVYLFGSQATDKTGRSSDVDIGILFDTSDVAGEIDKRNQYMVDLANILRKEIHPVVLNSAGEELMRQIFLKGKCILVRDPKKLSLFKMTMLARIADFGYYRDQMQSGLIRNIMES